MYSFVIVMNQLMRIGNAPSIFEGEKNWPLPSLATLSKLGQSWENLGQKKPSIFPWGKTKPFLLPILAPFAWGQLMTNDCPDRRRKSVLLPQLQMISPFLSDDITTLKWRRRKRGYNSSRTSLNNIQWQSQPRFLAKALSLNGCRGDKAKFLRHFFQA